MDTIILAGGRGKGLIKSVGNGPYSHTTRDIMSNPKPLVSVNDDKVLDYVLERLDDFYGHVTGRAYLTTNSMFQGAFENYFAGKNLRFPLEIVVDKADESHPETGAVRSYHQIFRDHIGDEALVIAGGNITSLDLYEMYEAYNQSGDSVIALFKSEDMFRSKKYGCAKVDCRGMITDFKEKPGDMDQLWLVNTMCYMMNKDDLASVPEYLVSGSKEGHLGWLLNDMNRSLRGKVFSGYWFDIADKASLKDAKKVLPKKK